MDAITYSIYRPTTVAGKRDVRQNEEQMVGSKHAYRTRDYRRKGKAYCLHGGDALHLDHDGTEVDFQVNVRTLMGCTDPVSVLSRLQPCCGIYAEVRKCDDS